MPHSLEAKVAIATGASRGIAAGIAERFAAEGFASAGDVPGRRRTAARLRALSVPLEEDRRVRDFCLYPGTPESCRHRLLCAAGRDHRLRRAVRVRCDSRRPAAGLSGLVCNGAPQGGDLGADRLPAQSDERRACLLGPAKNVQGPLRARHGHADQAEHRGSLLRALAAAGGRNARIHRLAARGSPSVWPNATLGMPSP